MDMSKLCQTYRKIYIFFSAFICQRMTNILHYLSRPLIYHISNRAELDIGVPEGRPWDHFFFMFFYINDLSQTINDGYNIFADDAGLYAFGMSISEVQMSLEKFVTNADDFNLLSVNTTKSFVMLVGSQQASHTNTYVFAIYLNNERLEQVKSAKYLGLEINSLLMLRCTLKKVISNYFNGCRHTK